MTSSAGFRFVSHQRRGLIALPGVATAGSLSAAAVLSDGSSTTPVTLSLSSVADVQGIDTTLVLRQYPRPNATDAEPEFFPLVEFGAPELPWLLPTVDGAHGPLPWLCLVVVEARDGVTITGQGLGHPDVLHISSPAMPTEELPDPADSALWAHAFAATAVDTAGSADPTETTTGATVSGCRLLAPRRLLPNTTYVACLVPTFAASALAGLGRSDGEVAAALAAPQPNFAWATSDRSVDLPVYLRWEFSCGAGGDFESLARALHEVPVGPTFGTRPLDLGLAGAGVPPTTTLATVFRGALTAPGIADEPAWPDPTDADQGAVDSAVIAEVAAAAALTAAAATDPTHPAGRPALGPLLYARAAAGRGDVGIADPVEDWFDQLNRDPRARSVAGIATRVLRRDVEDVMARAWQQVGQVDEANAALQRLQASRAVTASIHSRHLSGLSAGRLVAVARPVLGRVALPASAIGGAVVPDALAGVAASALPAGTTWRGVTAALRPGTRLGDVAAVADAPGRILTTLVAGLAEADVVPDGTVGFAAPSVVFGAAVSGLLTDQVRAAASTAQLAVPAAGATAETIANGIDALTATVAQLTLRSATGLASETGAVINARPLPATATFTQVQGVLVGPDRLPIRRMSPAATLPVGRPVGRLPTAPVRTGSTPTPIHTGPVEPIRPQPIDPVHSLPIGSLPVIVQVTGTDPRLERMRTAYAGAVDRFLRAGMSSPLPVAAGLDLEAARTAVLANLQPSATVMALAHSRMPALAGLIRPDPIAPVMAGPVFSDPAYTDLVTASHDAFVPGLDSIPPDSVTLVQTNPTFIAAYLAGLNSALGHELLWRGYPTDERGTYWHSFWGAATPDIGPLHLFHGDLADNVAEGTQPLLVLILRGRLLKRYPDSDIYAVLAGTSADVPELTDDSAFVRPLFRDFVAPDITLVGFPLTYDDVVGTAGGQGYWFVVAEHPGQPRFGLTDPDPAVVHPPLPTWDELSWADLGTGAAAATYLPAGAPPMAPAGTTRHWAGSAADMAAITYQPAVRVAMRARDLLASPAS